jgi:hypothetical protein
MEASKESDNFTDGLNRSGEKIYVVPFSDGVTAPPEFG